MKTTILNFALLLGILFVSFLIAMATPLSTTSYTVYPPDKTQRHLYLESKNNEGYSKEEIDELFKETEKFNKRAETRVRKISSPRKVELKEDLQTILSRIQYVFIIVILVFALVYRIKSYLDLLSVLLVLIFLTFVIPILSINNFVLSAVAFFIIFVTRMVCNPPKTNTQ